MESTAINPINGLIVVTALVAAGIILFRIASKVFKVVGIALVIGLSYYFWQGGTVSELKDESISGLFHNVPLQSLEDELCVGAKADRVKCDCIVEPVTQDLRERLSASQLAKASADPGQRVAELRASMRNRRKEIRQCLINNKGGDLLKKFAHVVEEASSGPIPSDR
jgi:hypothetical protein